MKKQILESIKNGLISGFTFLSIVFLGGLVFAAISGEWSEPVLVESNSNLLSEDWNKVQKNVKYLEEKYQSLLKTDGITSYVTGNFTDMSLSSSTKIAIINSSSLYGDSNLINGNTFKAPVDGLYSLSISSFFLSASANPFIIYVYKNTTTHDLNLRVAQSSSYGITGVGGMSSNFYLKAGDYISVGLYSYPNSSTIYSGGNPNGELGKFTFSLIGQ